VHGLDAIDVTSETVRIGALVSLHALERSEEVAGRVPLLAAAVREVATPQLRAMGTIGGNILQRPQCWYYRDADAHCLRKGGEYCHAVGGDNRYHAILGGGPCHIVCPSDLAQALLALGATVEVQGPAGTRTLTMKELFVGPRVDPHNEHCLGHADVVTAVEVPVRSPDARSVFLKARERSAWDFSLASVALELCVDGSGVATSGTMAFGGVAPNAWDASEALAPVLGSVPGEDAIAAAAALSVDGARPLRQNGYKVDLTRGLVVQALRSVLGQR
jgi:xanthine dehydrogenase YagS FAD-binding subunit